MARGLSKNDAWMALPVLYSVACWYVLGDSEAVRKRLPQCFKPAGAPLLTTTTTALLPRSVPQAFSLGRAVERNDAAEASKLLKTEVLRKDLPRIAEAIAQLATRGSPLQQLLGLLSFVNVLGVLALVGVAVSVGPAAWVLVRPVIEALKPLGRLVRQLASLLSDPAVFGMAAYLIAESTRLERHWASNAQVAALGALGVAPAALSWTLRRGLPFGWSWGGDDTVKILRFFAFWFVSHLAPVAVLTQSRLIGFAAVAALYAALGFVVMPLFWTLGWAIGFVSESAILRCEVASVLLLGTWAKAKDFLPDRAITPFRGGVAVFGSLALGLAELIASSSFVQDEHSRHYYLRNAISLGLFVATLAAGHLLHSPAIANTSLTFFVLWFTEKVMENAEGTAFWPSLLAVSGGLWWASLWLRAHENFLPAIFALSLARSLPLR